ncbi:MAG: ATP-binding cassette domain-containing protein [Dehalococcoidales bacterium]|nr:ATP-binding cassette domain-containing protein [Dehalococcoidales bacterium]
MPEEIIRAEGLSRYFGKAVLAVDNVSFGVFQGEIFGFLGPNGAGKTTTINMLTTVLKPTTGSARICGFNVLKQAREVRSCISVVPQEYTADEDLTGYENIMLCASLYSIPKNVAKQRADELLHLLALESASGRRVETYSGGMRRRLELASGLINRPHVLFLDEPTLGLDMQTRAAVWGYIRLLKEQYGMTLFMTTHYLEEADSLCDRVGIIDRGKLIKLGSPAELRAALGGDVMEIEIEDKGTDISEMLSELPKVQVVGKDGNKYRLKLTDGEEVAVEVIGSIHNHGHKVLRMSLTKPTLGDAYLELTGREMRDEQEGADQSWKRRLTMRRARG